MRSWHRRSQVRISNTAFWLGLLLLNGILFLPAYLLNADNATFWPTITTERLPTALFNLFLWRENIDIFRLNAELVLLLTAWLYLSKLRIRYIQAGLILLYLFMVFYYIYESTMLFLYRADPTFYADYFLARDGLSFLLEHIQLSSGFLVTAVAGLIGTVFILVQTFKGLLRVASNNQLTRASQLILSSLSGAILVSAIVFQLVLANPMMVISSAIFKLSQNITHSVDIYKNLTLFRAIEMAHAYDYTHFQLESTPDIYLIFIESYGSVLYKRPDYYAQYAILAEQTQQRLTEGGWHTATALSDSPTWGGGSWLAFTSTLFGLHIENHPQYLAIQEKYTLTDEQYPHLPGYLQSQGYQFVWMSPLADKLTDLQWRNYQRFYNYDRLVRYDDFEYTGPNYGWGSSPPDQYSLWFTHEKAIAPHPGPTVLFFITQIAHFPWAPIPPILDDWREFQELEAGPAPESIDAIEHATLRARYFNAIDYSLDMLTKFILEEASEDAIFVLVGDHQPPRVSRRNDGLDAPVHIISRDPNFTASLTEYGFVPDTLFLTDPTPTLRHEGIYSLLVRHLIQHYGNNPLFLPDYYPEGFIIAEGIGPEDIDPEDIDPEAVIEHDHKIPIND